METMVRCRSRNMALPIMLVLLFTTLGFYQKSFDLDRSDSALYAYGGFVLQQGGHLYRDLWDHKPPGVYAIDALAFWLARAPSWRAVVIADTTATLLAVLACALMFHPTRISLPSRTATGITAVVAAFYLNLAAFHRGGGLAEVYMIAFAAWSGYCFLASRASAVHRTSLLWLAGVLASLAILCKPTAGTVVLATGGSLLVEALWRGRMRQAMQHSSVYACGLALPMLLACGLFAWQGTLRQMIDASVLYNLSYLQHGDGWRKFIEFHRYHNLLLLPVGILAIAAGLLSSRQAGHPRSIVIPHRRPWLLFLPLWAVLEWLGAYAGNYDNGQYMFGCILPLSCLAGICGAYLLRVANSRDSQMSMRMTAGGSLLLSLVLAFLPACDQWRQTLRIVRRDMPDLSVELVRAGDTVRRSTQPADTIWVWGYAPQVYFSAQRLPATRYVFDGAFLNSRRVLTSQFDEMLRDLDRQRPACIVDAATTGWFSIPLAGPLPAHLSWQQAQYAAQIEQLRRWVQANYQYEGGSGEVVLYRLRPDAVAQRDPLRRLDLPDSEHRSRVDPIARAATPQPATPVE